MSRAAVEAAEALPETVADAREAATAYPPDPDALAAAIALALGQARVCAEALAALADALAATDYEPAPEQAGWIVAALERAQALAAAGAEAGDVDEALGEAADWADEPAFALDALEGGEA